MPVSPLQLALFALCLAAIYVQARIARVRDRAHDRADFEKALAQLREAAQTAPEPNPLSGMNLNKRTQAVRLLRRGEDVGHIAAALGVPRGEVELLVRVQQMSAHRALTGTAEPGRPTPPTRAD
jgi:DNA-binding NarL/FixJ family response regulator